MGHQSYVAAYLAVVLVFWVTWRFLSRRVRLLDGSHRRVLDDVSGGEWGTCRSVGCSTYACQTLGGHVAPAAGALALPAPFRRGDAACRRCVPLLTSPHARARLDRLGSAVQGTDPATSHRLIFWQVGVKAILERPSDGLRYRRVRERCLVFCDALSKPTRCSPSFYPLKRRRGRFGSAIWRSTGLRSSGTLELQPVKPYRVHNYFLDIGFASGIPVLLLFRRLSTEHRLGAAGKARTPVSLATLLALLTYLIYGMVWFATPNVDTLVWGLVGSRSRQYLVGA